MATLRHWKGISIGLAALAVSALAVFAGTRCRTLELPRGYAAEICKSWFRDRSVITYDRNGRIVSYAKLSPDLGTGAPPAREAVDLFGTGRISQFITTRKPLENRPGFAQTVEISSQDDGRIDLILEFEGVGHPMAGVVTKATRVRRHACKTWRVITTRLSGATLTRKTCGEPDALEGTTLPEIRRVLETVPIIREREGYILGASANRPAKMTLIEWGAPWTKRIEIQADHDERLRLARGLSDTSQKASATVDVSLSRKSEQELFDAARKAIQDPSGRTVGRADLRRLRIVIENKSDRWETTSLGRPTPAQQRLVSLVNKHVPDEYRLEVVP